MEVAIFIFDNQSDFFRTPQGAVSANQNIEMKIYVKKNLVQKPVIHVEKRTDYNHLFYKEIKPKWIGMEKSYDLYSAAFTVKDPGQYYYKFILGEGAESQLYELLIYAKDYTTPQWIKGGIIYHIFVDRFYKSNTLKKNGDIIIRDDWGGTPNYWPDKDGEIRNNDFFGGNLQGIKNKLPYLADMRITAIYLSPVFDAFSNHKYDTGNYFAVDEMFGGEEALTDLCHAAKDYGISIILDGVFSHTGADSIYFNKYEHYNSIGAYQSQSSPYYNWYIFNQWRDDYACWWGIKTLPAVDKDCQDYIDFITGENGVLKYWQERGINGWRLDVADELPNEFIEKIRTAVKGVNEQDKEAYLIGEVWEDAANKFSYGKLKEYFCGNQLDSVINYPLRDAIINYVKNKDCNLLYNTMNFITEKYPPQAVNCLMNILGTHDTERILTVLGCNEIPEKKHDRANYKLSENELQNGIPLLKIASLLQFTLPGVPCIYYGDEAGIEGFEDPFNRRCYPWGKENPEILSHYRFLSKMRKNPLFAEGKYNCLLHDTGVFAFERYDDDNKIVIAVNMSDKTVTLNFKETMKQHNDNSIRNSFNLNSEKFLILYNSKNVSQQQIGIRQL